ncbi:MAG: hypothetical protein KAS23_02055, partial [Anaerohalosphaera sp.]|nr:hypothetical protein [Anaerohalosphaera sp.]
MIASDLIRLFQVHPGSDSYQAGGKMCDRHLVAYCGKTVMCCLFGFLKLFSFVAACIGFESM